MSIAGGMGVVVHVKCDIITGAPLCGARDLERGLLMPPLAKQAFLHVLFRDSKLTMLLSDSLGNINCQTIMIAHIADSPADYMETLTTVQLASRIHCMKKKKSKVLVQLSRL